MADTTVNMDELRRHRLTAAIQSCSTMDDRPDTGPQRLGDLLHQLFGVPAPGAAAPHRETTPPRQATPADAVAPAGRRVPPPRVTSWPDPDRPLGIRRS